jgi:hypothetical protein
MYVMQTDPKSVWSSSSLLVWFYVDCLFLLCLSPLLGCSTFSAHSFTVISSNVQISICIWLLKHLFVSLLCISVPQSHSSVVKAAISNYRKVYICSSCMLAFSCEALAAIIWYGTMAVLYPLSQAIDECLLLKLPFTTIFEYLQVLYCTPVSY